MPTYEYRCAEGHDFEQLQKMSDPPIEKCPVCGAPAERKLSAGAGLLFKGSGFYITDYRSDNYKKAAESDKGSSGAAGGAPAPKADKPAGGASSGGTSAGTSSGGGSGSGGGAGSGGAAGGPKA
jgi:putative FmdB family regulatory protein